MQPGEDLDGDESRHIWIWLGDLAQPFDEDTSMREFVAFQCSPTRGVGSTTNTRFISQRVLPHLAGVNGKSEGGKKGKLPSVVTALAQESIRWLGHVNDASNVDNS